MKLECYKVTIGYSQSVLVAFSPIRDMAWFVKVAPTASRIGKALTVAKLVFAVVFNRKVDVELPAQIAASCKRAVVVPWSQGQMEKAVVISGAEKDSLYKVANGERAKKLLRNEIKGAKYFAELFEDHESVKILPPEVIAADPAFIIRYPYIQSSKRASSAPGFVWPGASGRSRPFYDTRYYQVSNLVISDFLSVNYPEIYEEFERLLARHRQAKVKPTPMHGDFSNSNVLVTTDAQYIIDFEDFLEDGLSIDREYYEFRFEFDRRKVFQIRTDIDFIVIYHYFYFQSRHKSFFTFDHLMLKDGCLKLVI